MSGNARFAAPPMHGYGSRGGLSSGVCGRISRTLATLLARCSPLGAATRPSSKHDSRNSRLSRRFQDARDRFGNESIGWHSGNTHSRVSPQSHQAICVMVFLVTSREITISCCLVDISDRVTAVVGNVLSAHTCPNCRSHQRRRQNECTSCNALNGPTSSALYCVRKSTGLDWFSRALVHRILQCKSRRNITLT